MGSKACASWGPPCGPTSPPAPRGVLSGTAQGLSPHPWAARRVPPGPRGRDRVAPGHRDNAAGERGNFPPGNRSATQAWRRIRASIRRRRPGLRPGGPNRGAGRRTPAHRSRAPSSSKTEPERRTNLASGEHQPQGQGPKPRPQRHRLGAVVDQHRRAARRRDAQEGLESRQIPPIPTAGRLDLHG